MVTSNGKLYYGNENRIIQKIIRKPVDVTIDKGRIDHRFLLTNDFIIYSYLGVKTNVLFTQMNLDPISTMPIPLNSSMNIS